MRGESEPFNVSEVDVVIADDEDICRAAAASALKRFGFLPARVHEVESGEEAMERIEALQNADRSITYKGKERSLPVIVFLDIKMPGSDGLGVARQLCACYTQQRLQREPFLVCATARRVSQSGAEQKFFHCAVPKTFATSKLRYCFDLCQQWWVEGGGEPGRVALNATPAASEWGAFPGQSQTMSDLPSMVSRPSPAASRTQNLPNMGGGISPGGINMPPSAPLHPSGGFSTTPSSGLPHKGGGNSIDSLDNLAPPRPPFEDVEMICLVGRGSFGRVYKARWDISTVALKVVEHFEEAKPSIMAFEGKLSSSLAHPNLVQTFKYSVRDLAASGEEGEEQSPMLRGFELWIVQEWCGLGTLNSKIQKKEVMSNGGYPEVIEVCAEVASAANYLHGRGIIHGDLTASNILLMERRCAKGYVCKVSDFGLARVLDSGASGINTATMGTVTYMPPELFQLEGCALTKKVDVYAFGVILWQLCTSSTPFEGLQPTQVVVMVAQGATLELPGNVPRPLSKTFAASIARKPSDRPPFERIVQDLLKMASLEKTTSASQGG